MRSVIGCQHLGSPERTWDQFIEAILDRFVPLSLKEQMRDEFDCFE